MLDLNCNPCFTIFCRENHLEWQKLGYLSFKNQTLRTSLQTSSVNQESVLTSTTFAVFQRISFRILHNHNHSIYKAEYIYFLEYRTHLMNICQRVDQRLYTAFNETMIFTIGVQRAVSSGRL